MNTLKVKSINMECGCRFEQPVHSKFHFHSLAMKSQRSSLSLITISFSYITLFRSLMEFNKLKIWSRRAQNKLIMNESRGTKKTKQKKEEELDSFINMTLCYERKGLQVINLIFWWSKNKYATIQYKTKCVRERERTKKNENKAWME